MYERASRHCLPRHARKSRTLTWIASTPTSSLNLAKNNAPWTPNTRSYATATPSPMPTTTHARTDTDTTHPEHATTSLHDTPTSPKAKARPACRKDHFDHDDVVGPQIGTRRDLRLADVLRLFPRRTMTTLRTDGKSYAVDTERLREVTKAVYEVVMGGLEASVEQAPLTGNVASRALGNEQDGSSTADAPPANAKNVHEMTAPVDSIYLEGYPSLFPDKITGQDMLITGFILSRAIKGASALAGEAFRLGYRMGNAEAGFYYAMFLRRELILRHPGGVVPDYAVILEEVAAKGNGLAQSALGTMYITGEAGCQDYSMAASLLHQAVTSEYKTSAALNLGELYYHGKGVERDIAIAIKYLTMSMTQGNPTAKLHLGTIYLHEAEFRNVPLGTQYMDEAAGAGLTNAQYNMGVLYQSGVLIEANIFKAIEFYEMAAFKGLVLAKLALADLFSRGIEVPRNYTKVEALCEEVLAGNDMRIRKTATDTYENVETNDGTTNSQMPHAQPTGTDARSPAMATATLPHASEEDYVEGSLPSKPLIEGGMEGDETAHAIAKRLLLSIPEEESASHIAATTPWWSPRRLQQHRRSSGGGMCRIM